LENSIKERNSFERNYRETYTTVNNISDIESNIDKYSKELDTYKEECVKHEENMEKVGVYQKYKEKLDSYNEWRNKVKTLTDQEKTLRLKYASTTLLKEIILRAESISIQNAIESINKHAQEYLNLFFPENGIVVRLLPFKETKKSTKPQINLEIQYKDMDADLSMLSGGELSRVVLAFTLALSEMYNSPLILLDECTASLDQDLTGVVMSGIKSNFNNKLVITIAHQVVGGNFDRSINL
jgi:DNA repair ATPase RecN